MSDVEIVMQPARYWRIKLYGYGAELVFGTSTKEEMEYWESDQARIDTKCPEDETPFEYYIWEQDAENASFTNVPEQFRREGGWYDQDDLAHASGVDYSAAYISIEEVDRTEWDADAIREVIEDASLPDFVTVNSATVNSDEFYPDVTHVFCGTSDEKGVFFAGVFETHGPLDLFKLSFKTTEFPNGYELVDSVLYDSVEIVNYGADTDGKSMDIGFIEL
jgi:hypothetical protein